MSVTIVVHKLSTVIVLLVMITSGSPHHHHRHHHHHHPTQVTAPAPLPTGAGGYNSLPTEPPASTPAS